MEKNLNQLAALWKGNTNHSFEELSQYVVETHLYAQGSAIKAINQMATLRNWLIGCYIVEYEQNGSDRAKYGDRLLKRLEERVNTKGLNETLFRNSRTFYKLYPQISELFQIHPMLSDELKNTPSEIPATLSLKLQICATASHKFVTPGIMLTCVL